MSVRTNSQATRTRAAFEIQTIRRDSFVLQPNSVEAAGRMSCGKGMPSCLLLGDRALMLRSVGQRPEHHLRLLLGLRAISVLKLSIMACTAVKHNDFLTPSVIVGSDRDRAHESQIT
jgi:hypothetical protein